MEIKTSFDILKMFEKFGNHLTQKESDNYFVFRHKKWIAYGDLIRILEHIKKINNNKCKLVEVALDTHIGLLKQPK